MFVKSWRAVCPSLASVCLPGLVDIHVASSDRVPVLLTERLSKVPILQVLPVTSASNKRRAKLYVPLALVKLAGMQPGPLTLESEAGDVWHSI